MDILSAAVGEGCSFVWVRAPLSNQPSTLLSTLLPFSVSNKSRSNICSRGALSPGVKVRVGGETRVQTLGEGSPPFHDALAVRETILTRNLSVHAMFDDTINHSDVHVYFRRRQV